MAGGGWGVGDGEQAWLTITETAVPLPPSSQTARALVLIQDVKLGQYWRQQRI